MLFSRWFSRSSKKGQGRPGLAGRRRTPRQPAVAARIERLEPRLLLTVLNVTTDADVVNDGDGVLSLREAILIANDSTGATTFDGVSSTDIADEISVTAPNYPGLAGTQLPTILESLRILSTRINAFGQSRIFDVEATATLRLENVGLAGGKSVAEDGGAIRNAGTLELINTDISQCFSYASGGAISNTGTLTIAGGSIYGNTADGSGGAIFNGGGTVTITGTLFERNKAGIDGGAVFNDGGTVTISGAGIEVNRAGVRGGGVFNAGTMTIADTTVLGNSARSYNFLTTGNILINHAPLGPAQLIEYSVDGTLVQTLPAPSGRDIAVSSADLLPLHFNATVHIHAGTQLKAYDPATGATSSFAMPGLSTASDVTHGGLAVFDRFVFATDQDTGDGLRGVIRRDPDNFSSAIRFGDIDCFDLNIGLDGLLYVLSTGDAVTGGGTRITVFDPLTTASLRTIDLPVEVRAIAVNIAGEIFTAGASGIQHFDANGNLLNTLSTSVSGLADIDIRSDEQYLLVVSSGGEFIITTPALDGETIFNSGPSDHVTFGAFIEAAVRLGPQNEGAGGGVFNAAGANLTITGGTFMFNSALLTGGALQNEGGTLTLDGVLIDRNLTDGDGAGLHNSGSSSVTASSVTFIDNRAEGDGGGVWTSASGTFRLLGGTLAENIAQFGGGLFAGSNTGTLDIADSQIYGNFGGGLQIEGGTTTLANSTASGNHGRSGIHTTAGTLQLLGVTIADNRNGGGLHNTGATLTLDNVIIDGNHYFGDGGGLHNSGSGSVTGSGVVITNNATGGDGGGIWTSGSDTFSLLGATIAGNYARNGTGAGLFAGSNTGTLNISDSTISGNHAGRSDHLAGRTGGGLQIEGGRITLANSTVSGNHADNGGGIFNAAGASLTITGGQITNNGALLTGGGLHNEGGTLTLDVVVIQQNWTGGRRRGTSQQRLRLRDRLKRHDRWQQGGRGRWWRHLDLGQRLVHPARSDD